MNAFTLNKNNHQLVSNVKFLVVSYKKLHHKKNSFYIVLCAYIHTTR